MRQKDLIDSISRLTTEQRNWVGSIVRQFERPFKFSKSSSSDLVSDLVLQQLGDALRIHHVMSRQPLTKDRFEYALERALNLAGTIAQLVNSRTNPGHDILIAGTPVALKTEAAKGTKVDKIHVSKWMELGKGDWQLDKLRDRFLTHLSNYDRVLTFRCLDRGPVRFHYELVEIPKALLLMAQSARLEVQNKSTQDPKPGYGYVEDARGDLVFSLYFDGGTERKLQIKHLRKSDCKVHATWTFESTPLQ